MIAFKNSRRWAASGLALLFAAGTAWTAGHAPTALAAAEPVSVQLLSVNDLHGKIDVTETIDGVKYGRFDYTAAYLKQREAANPNTLIVHAGDMVGGSSPVSALFQDEPTVELMEAVGFDVGSIGNHELDEGVNELRRLIDGGTHPNGTPNYDGIDYPVLAANIEYKDSGELVFDPYAIREVGGVKIGFIGVTTTETVSMVIPEGIKDIRFTDEMAAINKYVSELKDQGVRTIVVLAHNPGSQSGDMVTGDAARIAEGVDDEVDVIFSAHNHQKNNGIVDGKLIVQAWEYGKAIGDVDLTIDPVTGDVLSKKAEIVDVVQSGIEPDPQASEILNKYLDLVAPKLNAVVGESAVEMLKSYPTKEVFGDAGLGNFLADAMKWSVDSDFALMNGGGVRDNINAGPITWGELFNVQPFGNTVVRVEVTGAEFEEILNAMINPAYGPDSFIAGASYTWDAATSKVKQIRLPDGQPIDKDGTYSLAVNNYMYEQTSDKYKLLKLYGDNFYQGPIDVDATVDFLKSVGEPIAYEAEGRISTDITAPVIETEPADVASAVNAFEPFTFEATATDAGSGLKELTVQLDGQTVSNPFDLDPMTLGDGEHQLVVTATDKVGNTASKPFTLQAQIDLQHLDELVQWGVTNGLVEKDNSLTSKIEAAQKNQDKKAQIGALNALINHVKAQSGKKIDAEFAAMLIGQIQLVQEQLKQ